MAAPRVSVSASMTFDASTKEEAYKKVADHFALLARAESMGMKVDAKADWFDGSITVTQDA